MKVMAIDLFRTRLATATKEQLREEVVVLRWPAAVKINGWQFKEPAGIYMIKNKKPKKQSNRYASIIEDIFFLEV